MPACSQSDRLNQALLFELVKGKVKHMPCSSKAAKKGVHANVAAKTVNRR